MTEEKVNDPYRYHLGSYAHFQDGYWVFISFDDKSFIQGLSLMLWMGSSIVDRDKVWYRCILFTKEKTYEMNKPDLPISIINRAKKGFDLQCLPYFRLFREYSNLEYRIQAQDPENNISIDLNILPHNFHWWSSGYFGTLDSKIEGKVTIKDKTYPALGMGSFEHSFGRFDQPIKIDFWQYEVVSWYGKKNCYGSLIWSWLDEKGKEARRLKSATSLPDKKYHLFDSLQIKYLDMKIKNGKRIPTSWQVIAKGKDGTLEYTARLIAMDEILIHPSSDFWEVHYLIECEGRFIGIEGNIWEIRGKGGGEYVVNRYNPLENP